MIVIPVEIIEEISCKLFHKAILYLMKNISLLREDLKFDASDFSNRMDLLMAIISAIVNDGEIKSLTFERWIFEPDFSTEISPEFEDDQNYCLEKLALVDWNLTEAYASLIKYLCLPFVKLKILDLSYNCFWSTADISDELNYLKIIVKNNKLDLEWEDTSNCISK